MISLALKYRPSTWDELTEQTSISKILQRQIEINDIRNAYLFCGASGCGKTTAARIFARDINKGKGSPIEIDAASNSGVDNVRNLIQDAKERAIDSVYKIIILDECHALSSQAWQAFLKCIEEPPKYTIFIFCTTDPQKIPDTILSRVQRYNFTRISSKGIKERLAYICRIEGYINYEESVDYISKISSGGLRTAISYLEKCVGLSSDLNINNVLTALGNYSYKIFFDLINALIDGNEVTTLQIISYFYNEGNDLKLFIEQFLDFNLNICKYALFKSTELITIPSSMEDELKNCTNFNEPNKYYVYVVDKLLELKNMLKNDSNPKSTIEVIMLSICRGV